MLKERSKTLESISIVLGLVAEECLDHSDLSYWKEEYALCCSLKDYCIKFLPVEKHNIETMFELMNKEQDYVEWLIKNPEINQEEYKRCYMLAPRAVRKRVFLDLRNLFDETIKQMKYDDKCKKKERERCLKLEKILKEEDFHKIGVAIDNKYGIWGSCKPLMLGSVEYSLFLNLICYYTEFTPNEKCSLESISKLTDKGQEYVEELLKNPIFVPLEGINPSPYLSATWETRRQAFLELKDFIHLFLKINK